MKLKKYNEKRNFSKTTEPVGKIEKTKTKKTIKNKSAKKDGGENKNSKGKLIFVIQYHRATSNHYDFRLEFNGVLISFAVPKGISNNKKNLAIKVEDHPLDYANFEGVISKGEYGAGSVLIFDKGTYVPLCDFDEGLKNGKLKFELFGEKFSGIFNLIRIKDDNFLIFKDKTTEKEVENKIEKILNAKKAKNDVKNLSCELATLVLNVPTTKNFIYEIKYDGYRVLANIENKKVELKSRNGLSFNNKFPNIVSFLEKNIKDNIVLDGEVVCFDEFGRTDFGLLQNNIKTKVNNFCYVVFDILFYNGINLQNLPLIERKFILNEIVKTLDKPLIYSEFLNDNGKKLFNFAKKNNLEGIMCKDKYSKYIKKRTKDWLKVKCYKRQEFVILGYLTTNKNEKLSAIIVGYFLNNKFEMVGKVGTGFKEKEREELAKKFEKLKTNKPSFNSKLENVVYLKPKLVAEIQFSELTKSNLLRQASFIALREDKKPKEVKLEKFN